MEIPLTISNVENGAEKRDAAIKLDIQNYVHCRNRRPSPFNNWGSRGRVHL
jgi:hypothetical protein